MADEKRLTDIIAVTESMAEVKMKKLEWLWPGVIPKGMITMLDGNPGVGKSFLSIYVGAHISTGRPWPNHPDVPCEKGTVLMITAEDIAGVTLKPRFLAACADMNKVRRLKTLKAIFNEGASEQEIFFEIKKGIIALDNLKKEYPDLSLVIIDPITAYVGKIDSHDNAQVRGVMDRLAAWAGDTGVAILAITHLNKNANVRAIYRTMGSMGFTAVCRMTWHLLKDLEDKDRRLLLPGKLNVVPDTGGHAFSFQSVKVDEGGIVNDSAILSFEAGTVEETADEKLEQVISNLNSTRRKVGDWLKKMLEGGPILASDILTAAEVKGFREKTLRRVKKELQIKTNKVEGGAWEWEL